MVGEATRIIYEFWASNSFIHGSIYAEHDFASNQVLAKFEGVAEDSGPKDHLRQWQRATGGRWHQQQHQQPHDELGNVTSYTYASSGSGFLLSAKGPTQSYDFLHA